MANTKRQHEIIRLLQIKSTMRVSDLADHFSVTQTSIRRDLIQLEQDNFISRSHGYAKIIYFKEVKKLSERFELNIDEKRQIAAAAFKQISANDSIILDSGTTTFALAEVLCENPQIPLSIITNSIPVAATVSAMQSMQVTLTGGVVDPGTMALLGPDCDAFFEKIVVDTAFVGSTGIHPHAGLTSSSPFQVSVKRKIIQCANQVVALLDSSKFSSFGVNVFCGFDRLSCIITTKTKENKAILTSLMDKGIKIILA